ncbi:MAG: Cell-shape determining protein [Candidatus Adlerbacteria bacterium GW2011_GWC1_50_9]|uniref:Cell shape-determining protein MreB n=1 Tax=Candidatus Adlerbacteria bacterium GW2011_GWC1_50_9 TaxID=1618608 RepID=A0A0G1ZLF2_9BACT|nr:MAG: Cell-shape determining protein [Candidatus Adlerbacteria bacterium GW2011_GWC1_50_9]
MFVRKIGIDLGTANTLVFIPKKGIVANEPSVVAVVRNENTVLAVGNEARDMIGRTPDTITAYRPLREGVIADYRVTEAMLRYFINKAGGRFRLFRPEVMVGAGIPINEPSGHMVVDIGGGTTDIAVISLGGIVTATSVKVAGDKLDQAIADYIKKNYNLAIGDRTAEDVKIKIGSAVAIDDESLRMEIRGRDLMSGLPRTIDIHSAEVTAAIADELDEIIRAIKNVLHDTPPELSADIMNKGIVVSGGGALLRNIDELILQETGVPAHIAEEPLLCVAKGTGIALEHLDVYKRSIMSKR